jgi:tetratricopeptide (TPR) repeat protein
MKTKFLNKKALAAGIACMCGIFAGYLFFDRSLNANSLYSTFAENKIAGDPLSITYPFDGTLFPPEIRAPKIKWSEPDRAVKRWLVCISFGDGSSRIDHVADTTHWTPSEVQWECIKLHSVACKATVVIIGVLGKRPVSSGHVDIRTSTDHVGAPLFYREVNLPFREAVKDPRRIRWRFGPISTKDCPRVVLENLPVCGNCHSFSADGKTLGMDVDYANDKGSYAIVPVSKHMTLDSTDIITWSDYRRADSEPTFGLLSQVSPDGNWIVSTVKDNSVFVPKPQLDFSQLFFPVKGILALYNRSTRAFSEFPGGDDPRYVNSNPVWSPSGKDILFIRSKVYKLNVDGRPQQVLLTEEQCADFLKLGKLFLYDIYKVPFNNGTGGTAAPLAGASGNGMSNYFPRYSPNGAWIVFCKAKSYSLLQPDSRLYIIPAGGGEPRLMTCNRECMNSWHSWSPNGKWLVFSSKAFSPYTQLFLTHIDEKGMDTPPVVLDWFTAPDRAANIPEFVNAPDSAIAAIQEHFVNDVSYVRAAREYAAAYEFGGAIINLFNKALEINPANAQAHYDLGTLLAMQDKEGEAVVHFREAIRLDTNFLMAYCNLATAYLHLGRIDDASTYYLKALARESKRDNNARTFLYAHSNLALIYAKEGLNEKALAEYASAVALDPLSADLHCSLADMYLKRDDLQKARNEYVRSSELKPDFEKALYNLGIVYTKMKLPEKAREAWQKVLKINPENATVARALQTMKN